MLNFKSSSSSVEAELVGPFLEHGEVLRLQSMLGKKLSALLGPVQVKLAQVLDVETAERGLKKRCERVRELSACFQVDCQPVRQARGRPLHVTAEWIEGQLSVPQRFDEGFALSREGVELYARLHRAALGAPQRYRVVVRGATDEVLRFDAPDIWEALRAGYLTLDLANREKKQQPPNFDAADQLFELERNKARWDGERLVWNGDLGEIFVYPEEGTEPSTDGTEPVRPKPSRSASRSDDDRIVRLAQTAFSEVGRLDVLKDDRVRELAQRRAQVREWLENGGGDWEALVEYISARCEDPTYVPVQVRESVWALAREGVGIYMTDAQGNTYPVRSGVDVTGADRLWIPKPNELAQTKQALDQLTEPFRLKVSTVEEAFKDSIYRTVGRVYGEGFWDRLGTYERLDLMRRLTDIVRTEGRLTPERVKAVVQDLLPHLAEPAPTESEQGVAKAELS